MDLLELIARRPEARAVLDALAGEPGVHVVGGAVRDALLGVAPHELDVVVEGDAVPVARRAAERLGGDVVVHDRFGTATVRSPAATFDVVTARTEAYAAPGALPDVRPGASIEEDLARRDFTVNAIALRVADGALAEWPGARADLGAGVLRVLHERSFEDDPTRLLRLARYAAQARVRARSRHRRAGRGGHGGDRLGRPAGLGAAAAAGRAAARRAARSRAPRARARGRAPGVRGRSGARDGRDGAVPGRRARRPGRARGDADRRARRVARGARPARVRGRLRGRSCSRRRAARPSSARRCSGPATTWTCGARCAARGPEAVAVAGAAAGAPAAAERWLSDVRHRRLAITGDDFVAAGLEGPAVGAALEAAQLAALAGGAPGAAEQLAAGLAAVRAS